MTQVVSESHEFIGLSPRAAARFTGFLYLIIFGAGLLSVFYLHGKFIVSGNAAATAAKIMHAESAYRLATTVDVLILFCDISIALLLYLLLKPVNDGLSLFAAFFRLIFACLQAFGILLHLAPLYALDGVSYLRAFSPMQLQGLAMLSLHLLTILSLISLIFFGVHCLLIGALIARAWFLPRAIGILLVFAGLGYFAYSSVLFVPAFAGAVSPYALFPAAIAEGALTLWLLLAGVNAPRWIEQAQAHSG